MELVRNNERSHNLSDSLFSNGQDSIRNGVRLQLQVILPNTALFEMKNIHSLSYRILYSYERAKPPKQSNHEFFDKIYIFYSRTKHIHAFAIVTHLQTHCFQRKRQL